MEQEILVLKEQIKTLTEKVSKLEDKANLLNTFRITVNNRLNKQDNKNEDYLLFRVEKSNTIEFVKKKIEEIAKVPYEHQDLILINNLSCVELKNEVTLSDYNINEKSQIFLINNNKNLFASLLRGNYIGFLTKQNRQYYENSLRNQVSKKVKKLLYSTSFHEDTAECFHRQCDNQGPLLYLITTKQNIDFGIYVSRPICSDGQSRTDSLQMVICPSKNFAVLSHNSNATYHCYPNTGPQFHCMQINAPFLSSNCCDIQSCSDFDLPAYPSGNSSYQIKELEVYQLEDL